MYEMKAKAPPLANKRRSWTGRLKDRFKSSAGHHVSADESPVSCATADDWTTAWVTHPHLQEGHHAPSVPSLQGSVFVAANFVYDYRQKYGLDPANGWMPAPTVGSVAVRRTTGDWAASRGLYPVRTSPVFRRDPSIDRSKIVGQQSVAAENYSSFEFRAADVNQNIRQMWENKQHKVSISHTSAPPLPKSPPPLLQHSDEEETDGSSSDGSNEDDHPQTTVAVDRPGLIVSGQRICILTGQDSPTAIQAEKVSLKVEFQRNCALRRSLSDRARPKMVAPSFNDTTRLTQKTRSRGSLHDLFASALSPPEPLHITIPAVVPATAITSLQTPSNRRKTIVRPSQPPPPPPNCCIAIGPAVVMAEEELATPPPPPPPPPPVAPPRRVYRNSNFKADCDSLKRASSVKSSSDSASVPVTPTPVSPLDLSPGITSWAGRPLIGQMVSWTAWSGQQQATQESETGDAVKEENKPAGLASSVITRQEPLAGDEPKRRPVSRLWPSFSSIGRDRSASRVQQSDQPQVLAAQQEEEHIYEEIDESKDHQSRGLSRAGRGGSFAGASRQDILRYLEELRKKHPTGIISVEAEQRERKRTSSPSPHSNPMTPSLPQLIPADEEEDDEMGALLLAMRHNGPNRNSNRSTQSSTSTQSSSQESGLSSPGITPTHGLLSVGGVYQNGGGSGGGEIERNDSGVGSETSGTAQRLRRMRRLKSSHHHQQHTEGSPSSSPTDGCPSATPWCVDCDQPIESEQEGHDSLVCHRCARRRCERREVLAELLETEVRYGRDLRVLQDELYKPLLVAGLVPLRQLDAVFLNVSELSGQSQRFGQRLREAVEIALEQGDEDLLTVDVARLFLDKETEEMMDAFRRYCVRSGEASLLLSTLEKERELLRIFLRASQLENPALRRMDLHAFLMVPVQRITKYPLLLGRLLRATAQQDVEMREALREAQAKVESYLTAINAEAKELGTVSRPWRRGYSVPNLNNVNASTNNSSSMQRPSGEELMNLRLRKMAMDCLGWSDNANAQLVLEGYVKLTQPGELLLTTTRSRGRTLKWQNVWIGLVTLNHHQDNKLPVLELGGENMVDTSPMTFGVKQTVQEAAVVLIKDVKNTRPGPSIYRDPLMLSHCTISSEADELPNFFEIHHIVTKESFICQTADAGQTQQWLHRLRTLSLGLGRWKQRRNALPHVMMIN